MTRPREPDSLPGRGGADASIPATTHDFGTIEVGKLADFAVLSDDPRTCAEDSLRDIVSVLTVVGGQIVYEAK